MAGVDYNITVAKGKTAVYGGLLAPVPVVSPIQRLTPTSQFLGQDGVPKFICSAGDPEGFLYLGTKQGDGTRLGGNQQLIIDNLNTYGGNALYMMAVRSPGDGDTSETPWVDGNPLNGLNLIMMAQWEGWITELEANGVYLFFFIWDDHIGTPLFGTGDTSPTAEQAFITELVNTFKHHNNIIWMIGEEYTESFTAARCQAQADVIEAASSTHLIGTAQLSSNQTFDFPSSSNLRFFGLQSNTITTPAEFNATAKTAHSDAAANDFLFGFLESFDHGTGASARKIDWALAMGGASAIMRYPTRPDTAAISDLQDMQRLVNFMEMTGFYNLEPSMDLTGGSVEFALLDMSSPWDEHILYSSNNLADDMAVLVSAGIYDVTWQSCDTDTQVTEEVVILVPSSQVFTKPASISNECAVWIRKQ